MSSERRLGLIDNLYGEIDVDGDPRKAILLDRQIIMETGGLVPGEISFTLRLRCWEGLWIASMGSQVRFGSCNSDIHTPTPDVIKEMRD